MNEPTTTHINPCFSSTPRDGIVHRCALPMHFGTDHDSGLYQWPDMVMDDRTARHLMNKERTVFRGRMPRRGLATEDVLVAPPSARNVTPTTHCPTCGLKGKHAGGRKCPFAQ